MLNTQISENNILVITQKYKNMALYLSNFIETKNTLSIFESAERKQLLEMLNKIYSYTNENKVSNPTVYCYYKDDSVYFESDCVIKMSVLIANMLCDTKFVHDEYNGKYTSLSYHMSDIKWKICDPDHECDNAINDIDFEEPVNKYWKIYKDLVHKIEDFMKENYKLKPIEFVDKYDEIYNKGYSIMKGLLGEEDYDWGSGWDCDSSDNDDNDDNHDNHDNHDNDDNHDKDDNHDNHDNHDNNE